MSWMGDVDFDAFLSTTTMMMMIMRIDPEVTYTKTKD
jgi:hypothetical protein